MIRLLSTEVFVKPKSEQDYLEVLGTISDRMRIRGIKAKSLTYRISPDDINRSVKIITLDLQEHVN